MNRMFILKKKAKVFFCKIYLVSQIERENSKNKYKISQCVIFFKKNFRSLLLWIISLYVRTLTYTVSYKFIENILIQAFVQKEKTSWKKVLNGKRVP